MPSSDMELNMPLTALKEIDEQMAGLDRTLSSMDNTDASKSNVRGIKERHAAKFHVENGIKKVKRGINKLHIAKGPDGTKFIRDSDDSDSSEDGDAIILDGVFERQLITGTSSCCLS